VTLAAASEISDELRRLWEEALRALRATRGGPELAAQSLPSSPDPLRDLVDSGSIFLEERDGELVGLAVVRDQTIVGVYVVAAQRRRGLARAIAAELFALADPPRDALALPGDRATKSLYESLGLKARLLTMRAE
jgi:hypothetical protein